MYETIRIERGVRGAATLWLARPDKHNALSPLMMRELTAAAQRLGADGTVRVVVLAADGVSFCAGGDLGWMQEQMRADTETRRKGARELALMLNTWNELPKPLIGRVQGNAFGGGVGLISVCDVAIGVSQARFGLTETRLGLIPAVISPYVLARMGEAGARRVFMSSRPFDAAEAVRLNLLARTCSEDELDCAIATEVEPYFSCAPAAVAAAKRLARGHGPRIDAEIIEATINELVTIWEGDEAAEGIAAFFEKRKPRWQV